MYDAECTTILRFVNKQKGPFLRFRIFSDTLKLSDTPSEMAMHKKSVKVPFQKKILFNHQDKTHLKQSKTENRLKVLNCKRGIFLFVVQNLESSYIQC